jgi:PAS domain S-box-containing protein
MLGISVLRVDFYNAAILATAWITLSADQIIILSNLVLCLALFLTAFFLFKFNNRSSTNRLSIALRLSGAFILLCGSLYLLDAVAFWWHSTILNTILLISSAILSWFIVVAMYRYFAAASSIHQNEADTEDLRERIKFESTFIGLLESAPDAMVITSDDGKIQMVNAQTERLFGYERKDMVGKEVELLIPERFHHNHVNHRQNYVAIPKVREMGVGMDLSGKRKDGREFPVSVSLSPMEIKGENRILVISAIRDISRQKEAETEIRKLNENLENLVVERTSELELALQNERASTDKANRNQERLAFLSKVSEILASSLDYSITLQNIAKMMTPEIADWCTIDEIDEVETVKRVVVSHMDPLKIKLGFEMAERYPPDPESPYGLLKVYRTNKPEFYQNITNEMAENRATDEEHLRLIRELGIISAILVPLVRRDKVFGVLTLGQAESGRVFEEKDIEIARELAQRITIALENAKLYNESLNTNADLEQRVIRRTKELEEINKELEAFSYSVSHDLRAPLRSIDGFSNIILQEYNELLDEEGKGYFKRVKDASKHMGHLIDDMLKLSQISRAEINIEITNLSEITEAIALELKSSDPERKVNFIIQQEIYANADQHLIQIAMQNLIGNAWKYSGKNPESEIEFGSYRKEDQTVYFVRDNGVGFDMEYVGKLFGAFQRLHNSKEFEGTGIGLATVQRIIRRHHGKIWVHAEVHKGATFFFTL